MLTIGTFNCPAQYRYFEDTGPIENTLLVFPRTSVKIRPIDKAPVVACPNVVLFYNRGQEYTRHKLSAYGDICDWFAFHPQTIVETILPLEPAVQDRMDQPFRFTHTLTKPYLYQLQRSIVTRLHSGVQISPFWIEETMMLVLNALVENAYRQQVTGASHRPTTQREHQDLATAVQELLARRFHEPLTLAEIAQTLFTSPYHLCRVFRQQLGCTIHQYLTQLRLLTSLDQVISNRAPLTDIGISLGFGSHSHFTQSFRNTFGVTPSQWRANPSDQKMSNFLIA